MIKSARALSICLVSKLDTVYIEKPQKQNTEAALAAATLITQSLQSVEGVLRELIRASMSSPLMAVTVTFISSDILEKAGLIKPNTSSLLKLLAGGAMGASLAGTVLDDISQFAPDLVNQRAAAPNALASSGSVFVFGQNSNDQINALLSKYDGGKK